VRTTDLAEVITTGYLATVIRFMLYLANNGGIIIIIIDVKIKVTLSQ